MYRVAIVGAGVMAATHARSYDEMPGASLVGVADVRQEAAEKLAAEYHVRAFDNMERMLAELKPDVVDICVPTPLHVDLVCQAAETKPRGIVVEKPMGRTVEECERMIAVCEKAGVALFVAHVVRFFPEYAAAKTQVDAGAVGRVAAVRTRRGGAAPDVNQWYSDSGQSGGLVLDLLVHDYDWLRWTFGDVERVYAKTVAAQAKPGERLAADYALVTLRHRSGVVGHVEGTWADPAGFKTAFEIAGDEGLLEYNFNQPASPPFTMSLVDQASVISGDPIPGTPLAVNPYRAELEHFLGCLETGQPPLVTPQDATEAVRIANAAMESARTGKPVAVKG